MNPIQTSIDFIEENIREKLTLDLLAAKVGYSKYHFSKLFKKETGLSVHQYINNRKMILAAADIYRGERILDVAIKYGYETQTGFGKAFYKKFHHTPNMIHLLRLSQQVFIAKGDITMKNYGDLKDKLKNTYDQEAIKTFDLAYEFMNINLMNKRRYSGEPYINHVIAVADILYSLEASKDLILIGLLHELTTPQVEKEEQFITSNFGQEIYETLRKIQNLNLEKIADLQEDLIMVKLADRLHNMQTLCHLSPTRWAEKIKETLDFFLPLAKKLQLYDMIADFEEVCDKYK